MKGDTGSIIAYDFAKRVADITNGNFDHICDVINKNNSKVCSAIILLAFAGYGTLKIAIHNKKKIEDLEAELKAEKEIGRKHANVLSKEIDELKKELKSGKE